LEAFLNGLFLC